MLHKPDWVDDTLSALSVTPPEDNCREGDTTKQLDSLSQPLFADVDKQSEP